MEQGSNIAAVIGSLIYLAVTVAVLAGMWKVFTKAGEPGWGILVPFYNLYLMLKIAGRPAWWMILMFVPIANLVIMILMSLDIARAFGKGTGFGLGLTFLGFAFYPILGFSDARYQPIAR